MKARHMENVTMKRRGQFLSLEVPGLAEKRPSLVHGDFIFAKFACEDQGENSYPYQVHIFLFKILTFSFSIQGSYFIQPD